jgi:hypothetical protein
MTAEQVESGIKAILDEALAVATGEICETEMSMPMELEDLIRVETFAEAGISGFPGIVIRFKSGDEWQLQVIKSK